MKGRRNGTLDAQQKAFIYSAVSCTRFSQYDLSCPWKHLCCCTNCSDCDFNKIPFRLIAMKIRYSPIVLKVSLNPNQSNICAMCPVKAPMWCVALIEQFHFIFWPSVTRRGANLQQFFVVWIHCVLICYVLSVFVFSVLQLSWIMRFRQVIVVSLCYCTFKLQHTF